MTSLLPAELDRERASAEAVRQFLSSVISEVADWAGRAEAGAVEQAAELILRCERMGGRVHVTGVGKPEHVARYIASLLSSTGTPSYFLHATECRHGSAGQLRPGDVVIAVSNSGATAELIHSVEVAKQLGASIIGVSGDAAAPLATISDVFLDAGVKSECDPIGLVPRASFLAQVIVLSALSVALQTRKGLTPEQYAVWHPSGVLGRKARERPRRGCHD